MKNKSIKLVLLSTLLLATLTGCNAEIDKNKVNTNDQNIVIDKVETSSELLKNNDKSSDDTNKKKLDDQTNTSLDLSSIDKFKKFKMLAKEVKYIEYSESNKENFDKKLKEIFDSNDVFSDEKIYTYDDFIDNYIWSVDSGTGVYLSDVNNDGLEDILAVYKNSGTANFAGINGVFLKTNNGYEIATIESEEGYVSNDVTLLNAEDKTYVCMTFGILDEIYVWSDNSLLKIADEDAFVDNDHITKDQSLINNEIFKEFQIDKKVNELKADEISYENSGYSDEEVLTTYFKIKKYIEEDEKETLAELIIYPIQYSEGDKYTKVYNKEQFINNYDKIITDDVKDAVAKSNYKEIFSSWRGAMLGNGEIWFTNRIIAIN